MALSRLNLLRPPLLRCPFVVASRLQRPPPLPAACLRLYATKKAKGQRGESRILPFPNPRLYLISPFSSRQPRRRARRPS